LFTFKTNCRDLEKWFLFGGKTMKKKLFVRILIGLLLSLSGCENETGDNRHCDDMVLYGPASCASDEQCVEEYGAGWYCDEDSPVGPPECDLTWPACVNGNSSECEETVLYGPQGCVDDEQCIAENGVGWYCDQDAQIGPPECGYTWPVCKNGNSDECGLMVLYGPAPCLSDEQCVAENSAGWYCDEDNPVGPPECGYTWPVCKDGNSDECGLMVLYGPMPCLSDEQCVAENSAGWYCDEDNPVGPPECGYTWPVCKDGNDEG
jgi:hypothetical protein